MRISLSPIYRFSLFSEIDHFLTKPCRKGILINGLVTAGGLLQLIVFNADLKARRFVQAL